jgi:protein-disulfide isomerase
LINAPLVGDEADSADECSAEPQVHRESDQPADARWQDRIDADRETADLSGVTGTPSFFVDGQRN